jgi:RNA polymerase sigma-70 factor, ECF subfamily
MSSQAAVATSPAPVALDRTARPPQREGVHEYRGMIYRTSLRFLRDPEDAEDATQDVLVRAVRFLPAFGNRSALTTWLYRVTHNVCMNHLRRRERDRACRRRLTQQRPEVATAPDDVNERLAVRDAVQRLPAHYRRPLVLFFFRELSYCQIALELGLPVNTVKIRIHRAKILLRRAWLGDRRA